jgi:hypothetical protein
MTLPGTAAGIARRLCDGRWARLKPSPQAVMEEVKRVDPRPAEVPLSPRELDILEKVAYGATTQLGMSSSAVEKELDRIFEKLGASHPPWRMSIAARSASVVQRRKTPDGDTIRLCQEHRCCYEVMLRVGAGVPLNRAGEWHFRWSEETRKWRLQDPARQIKTERDVPEGVSPTVALIGAISGKAISDIAEQIERLGFPPRDWGSGRTSGGRPVVKEPTEIHRNRS